MPQEKPKGAVTKFRICVSLVKIQAVTHFHIRQVKYPLESEIETESTLRMPF
jgi:hypothetical protein